MISLRRFYKRGYAGYIAKVWSDHYQNFQRRQSFQQPQRFNAPGRLKDKMLRRNNRVVNGLLVGYSEGVLLPKICTETLLETHTETIEKRMFGILKA